MRYYLSSHGASIDKAKDILRLQTHSMCRRQTLLKAAKQQWRHNMHETPDPDQVHQLEGIRKNLEEVTCKYIHLLIHMDSSDSENTVYFPVQPRLIQTHLAKMNCASISQCICFLLLIHLQCVHTIHKAIFIYSMCIISS